MNSTFIKSNATREAGQTIEILSRHSTLSEAVEAAGIDLSYNPKAAADKIKDMECGFRGCKSGEAFVTALGVYFVFNCDIKLLNKFEPFHSVMDDSPFRVVLIQSDLIFISESTIKPTPENRKSIAKIGILVTKAF